MKEKPNEWISIADMMAGVVGILGLMVALLTLKIRATESVEKKTTTSQTGEFIGTHKKVMTPFCQIKMERNHFDESSACLNEAGATKLNEIYMNLLHSLNDKKVEIVISGYADNIPYRSNPVTSYRQFCAPSDGNFSISFYRAANVRWYLLGKIGGANHLWTVNEMKNSRPVEMDRMFAGEPKDALSRFAINPSIIDKSQGKIYVESHGSNHSGKIVVIQRIENGKRCNS